MGVAIFWVITQQVVVNTNLSVPSSQVKSPRRKPVSDNEISEGGDLQKAQFDAP